MLVGNVGRNTSVRVISLALIVLGGYELFFHQALWVPSALIVVGVALLIALQVAIARAK